MTKNFPVRLINEWIAIEIVDQGIREKNGILLPDDDMQNAGIRPRIAKVLSLSEKAKEDSKLEVDDYILVKHLGWTRSVELAYDNGLEKEVWFTIKDKIVSKLNDLDENNMPIIKSEIK